MSTETALSDRQIFLDAGKIAARLAQYSARIAAVTQQAVLMTCWGTVMEDLPFLDGKPEDIEEWIEQMRREKPGLSGLFSSYDRLGEVVERALGSTYTTRLPLPIDHLPEVLITLVVISTLCKDGVERLVPAETPADLEERIKKEAGTLAFQTRLLAGVIPNGEMTDGVQVEAVTKFCEATLRWASSIWHAAADMKFSSGSSKTKAIDAGLRAIFALRYMVADPGEALSKQALRDLVTKSQGRIQALDRGGESPIHRPGYSVHFQPVGAFAPRA